jgi:hypothetical protein
MQENSMRNEWCLSTFKASNDDIDYAVMIRNLSLETMDSWICPSVMTSPITVDLDYLSREPFEDVNLPLEMASPLRSRKQNLLDKKICNESVAAPHSSMILSEIEPPYIPHVNLNPQISSDISSYDGTFKNKQSAFCNEQNMDALYGIAPAKQSFKESYSVKKRNRARRHSQAALHKGFCCKQSEELANMVSMTAYPHKAGYRQRSLSVNGIHQPSSLDWKTTDSESSLFIPQADLFTHMMRHAMSTELHALY